MDNNTKILLIWSSAIVGVAWAGAWKLGEGGGWLIFLAFLMAGGITYKSNNKKADGEKEGS